MLIDTHCHLNFEGYDPDRALMIARAAEAGVTRVVIPSVNLDAARSARRLAELYPGVYCAAGIHPNDTAGFEPTQIEQIAEQAAYLKVVAIGEIGLDYHWDYSPKPQQFAAFEAQLTLAAQLGLPVIIHNREASADLIPILEAWANGLTGALRSRPGVLHSYSAPPEAAARALAAGFYLGFTGPITYKKADDLRAIVRSTPLERIVVETDGPYLTPHPYRSKRNEPMYVRLVAEQIAALHERTIGEIEAITTTNAERLFSLPGVFHA
jgi:TatD DNase family protein